MKKEGITKQNHLIYCIENYIIRTQSMYDRLLRLVDKVFELYNPSHMISHELITSNSHLLHSPILNKLKTLRKLIKKYYYDDRNRIIHEQQFLEDDIRALEIMTLLTSEDFFKGQQHLIKKAERQVVKNKTVEFSKFNHDVFVILGDIFNLLKEKYEYKREILEAIYGKSELAEIPKIEK